MGTREVVLQRENRTDLFGVQFSPYLGISEIGVQVCGITPGACADGLIVPGEWVKAMNGKTTVGLTYPEAVNLMKSEVMATWVCCSLPQAQCRICVSPFVCFVGLCSVKLSLCHHRNPGLSKA